MSNDFYNHGGAPAAGSVGSSAVMRAEFDAVMAGFDKMPTLSGNAGRVLVVNAGATALSVTTAFTISGSDVTVAGGLTVTGAFAANGGAALGNAPGDALTIASNTVTWSGSPVTHSGNHVLSGNLTVAGALAANGGVTLGDAAGDTLTITSNTASVPNGLTLTGGSVTVAGVFTANGGATLGDAPGDALTINSSAVSTPNGLNFDSNTLVIDATNNRVGVGAAPATAFHAQGVSRFVVDSGTSSAVQFDFNVGVRRLLAFETGGGNSRPLLIQAQNVSFSDDSAVRIAIDTSGNHYPFANNSYSSGKSTERWSNVFSVLGNYTGKVTSSFAGQGFLVDSVNSGGINSIQVNNGSNSAGSESYVQTVAAGALAGDAYYQAIINGVIAWSWGVDNSDSDAWVLASSATLGTANVLRATSVLATFSTGAVENVRSSAGTSVTLVNSNTDNTSGSSHSVVSSVSGGASGGDAYFLATVTGATTWAFGADNSDADAYVVSASSALGTNNVLRASTAGAVSIPLGGLTVSGGDMATIRSQAGGSVIESITNTSTAASSDALLALSANTGTAGDAYVRFTIAGAADYALGVDNSASDAFVGSVSTTLGTNNWLSVATTGAVTFPDDNGVTVSGGDFTVSRSSAGGIVRSTLSNPNTGASSDARFEVTVGAGTSGEPSIGIGVSAANTWRVGLANTFGDEFYIAPNITNFSAYSIGMNITVSTGQSSFTGTTNSATQPTFAAYNSNVAAAAVMWAQMTAASPNNATTHFLRCVDSGPTTRAEIRTNGGLANFSANNVNLSDERVKKDVQPAESYWDKLKNVEVVTFLYKDQTDDEPNLGVIAQQLDSVAPELVDHTGFGEDGLLAVYQTDIQYATIKALQEAMERIEELERKLA